MQMLLTFLDMQADKTRQSVENSQEAPLEI